MTDSQPLHTIRRSTSYREVVHDRGNAAVAPGLGKNITPIKSSIKYREDENGVTVPSLSKDGAREKQDNLSSPVNTEIPSRVSVAQLFRYAAPGDLLLLFIGTMFAVAHGTAFPLFAMVFGETLSAYSLAGGNTTFSTEKMVEEVGDKALQMVWLAGAVLVASSIHSTCFTKAGECICQRIRRSYFKALLRQGVPFYEKNDPAQIASSFGDALPRMEAAMGINWGAAFQSGSQLITGLVIGLITAWKVGLAMLVCIPFIAIGAGGGARALRSRETRAAEVIASASAFVDEICTLKRLVVTHATEQDELEKFKKEMKTIRKSDISAAISESKFLALYNAGMGASMSVAFYVGYLMVRDGEIDSGDVTTAFIAIIIAGISFAELLPAVLSISAGREIVFGIYQIIDAPIEMDSLSEAGVRPEKALSGEIKFDSVSFEYPTRPDEPVFRNLTFDVKAKATVAIVGSSGSGKSTVVSLLERFYNHSSGSILIDNMPIGDFNVQWLRQQIALVSQTPALFPGTVFENIAIAKNDATIDEVQFAAKQAAAHGFISALPHGYDTMLTDGGQLSGGQRQRIAIARALIREPSILLLDEATSALDTKSEEEVQIALNTARSGRTTIIVAHRLVTVADADCIFVLDKGDIVESGTHQELMQKRGRYFSMVQLQDAGGDDTDVTSQDDTVDPSRITSTASFIADMDPEKLEVDDLSAYEPGKHISKLNKRAVSKLTKPDRILNFFAFVGGILHGYSYAGFGMCIGQVIGAVARLDEEDVEFWTSMFGVHMAIGVTGAFVGGLSSGYAGARSASRLRIRCFKTILSKQMGWHDLPQNTRGLLVQRITDDCRRVRHAASDKLLARGKASGALIGAITLSLIFCFRIAFVVIACIPFLVMGGMLRVRAIMLASGHKSFELSQVFASDAIRNIPTVISVGAVAKFIERYGEMLRLPETKTVRFAPIRGIMLGAGMAVIFCTFALNLYFAAINVEQGWCNMGDSITALFCVIFGGMRSGAFLGEAPNHVAGAKAARRVQKLLEDRELEAPPGGDLGSSKWPCSTNGEIEFQNVRFAYPSRTGEQVLDGFSLKVHAGEMVALVGESGSGKSTIVSLLSQFYQPSEGKILVDGHDIHEYCNHYFREIIGNVDQEPQLFSTTVSKNVTYGAGYVDGADIWNALESANAKDFVAELTDGIDTDVGRLGSRLSGGQRQRVAISRLFLRGDKVKILLLDEATSALDTTSELLVQEGLERLRVGKTTIVIAHRLSTVRQADRIVVLDRGKVLEQGTHDELYEARGHYFNLVQSQSIEQRASAGTIRPMDSVTEASSA